MATTHLNQPTSASDGNIPFVGTDPDDNTGSTLRAAFQRVNARLIEIFGSQNSSNVVQTPFVDADNIKDNLISGKTEMTGDVADTDELMVSDDGTIKRADFSVVRDAVFNDVSGDATIAAGGVLTIENDSIEGTMLNTNSADGTTIELSSDSLSVLKVPNDLTVDNSTIALDTGTTFNGTGARTVSVKDDGITHAKLEPRYTASKTNYGNISTDTTIDWSAAAVHEITMTGAATLNFNNYKKGQVIDLLITGNVTITFGTFSGTPSINQVGSSTYDGTKTNIIQVLCTDDDATPTFLFAVGDYTSDTNPA